MKNIFIYAIVALLFIQGGCATAKDGYYEVEMTRRDGLIFVGFTCNAPSGWSADKSSKDAIRETVRQVIRAELARSATPNLTVTVDGPISFEGSTGRLEFFAAAGDVPLDELIAKTRQIIAADPLGKTRPTPFYRANGRLND